ncbi:ion transporter [Sunxiuqinia sp. A32]|uniref:ion transporter n=1 Tax=Sunxiuqinia sp. A32 TaxID=3461496 RepID=UPI0040454DFC
MKLKHKIFHLVEKGSHGSKMNLIFDYSIMALIILNTIAIILKSIPEINSHIRIFLIEFEIFSVIIFSIEYLLRIYVADMTHPSPSKTKSIVKFIFSPYGIIDLLAILPFYLPFIISIDLRFLRILRLMRFLRLMKINRYNSSLKLIGEVIKEKKTELAMTGFITLLILLIASFLMYDVEGKVQPEKFPNILACFWWAIATLTTVGYGDVYPITALGKFISGVIATVGIGIVALPTGIISAGFMGKIENKKNPVQKCPHCGKNTQP